MSHFAPFAEAARAPARPDATPNHDSNSETGHRTGARVQATLTTDSYRIDWIGLLRYFKLRSTCIPAWPCSTYFRMSSWSSATTWRLLYGSSSYSCDNAASKFENRISYVHDIPVVRHNNECVAPAPACATQQAHYVSCILVIQISGSLIVEDENWIVGQSFSNAYALFCAAAQPCRP